MTSQGAARAILMVFLAVFSVSAASAAVETDVAVVEGTPRNAPDDPRGTAIPGSEPAPANGEPTARGTTDRTSGAGREATDRARRRPEGKFPWMILLLLVVVGGAAASR